MAKQKAKSHTAKLYEAQKLLKQKDEQIVALDKTARAQEEGRRLAENRLEHALDSINRMLTGNLDTRTPNYRLEREEVKPTVQNILTLITSLRIKLAHADEAARAEFGFRSSVENLLRIAMNDPALPQEAEMEKMKLEAVISGKFRPEQLGRSNGRMNNPLDF